MSSQFTAIEQLETTLDGISIIKLSNSNGTSAHISNYGGILMSFVVKDNNGKYNDLVLGFDKIENYFARDYLNEYPWFGAAIGRYANRVKNGQFSLNGKNYHLSCNKGNDHLHGGDTGFDKKIWQIKKIGESPYPFVELFYESKDGDEGYPGNLQASLRFELNDADELSYTYNATTDAPTPVNLTHHSYFNLNNGDEIIHNHSVKIYAEKILKQDDNLVANGELEDIIGTSYDFTQFSNIGNALSSLPEIDKTYVCTLGKADTPVMVAEAKSSTLGIHLQVLSTEPVVHFYTGKWIPSVMGKNNKKYGAFSGFCLETHSHPNALNVPSFPNTILQPGEKYYSKTIYRIVR